MTKKLRQIIEQKGATGWYSKDSTEDYQSAVLQHKQWSKPSWQHTDKEAKIAEVKRYIENHPEHRAENRFSKGDKVRVNGVHLTVTGTRHPMVYTDKHEQSSPGGGIHHTKVFK